MSAKQTNETMARVKTILVAEDDPDHVRLIEMALKRLVVDIELRLVPDGEDAIKYLRAEEPYSDRAKFPIPSLMLLDLKMPKIDGFEVLQWIRSHAEWRCLPVVVLTTSYYGPDIERAYDLGANSFLTKPLEFSMFLATLREVIDFWLFKNELPQPGPFLSTVEPTQAAEQPAPPRVAPVTPTTPTNPESPQAFGRDVFGTGSANYTLPGGGLNKPWTC